MERVFTTDVRNRNGDVKYRAGEKRDWPKATWDGIATSLGEDLDDFSVSPEAAGALVASAAKNRKAPAKASAKGKPGGIRRV